MQNPFKRSHVVFLIIFIIAVAGVNLWQRWYIPTAVLELKGTKLDVMVAKTPAQQYRGLGKRDSLDPYDGMLFLFWESAEYAIVMRDMEFPIDIVWLDQGVVVDIAPNVQTEQGADETFTRYYPRKQANMVLELSAGWAEAHGLKIGDTMKVVE